MLRWRPILWGLASLVAGFTLSEVFGHRISQTEGEQRKLKETTLLLLQQVDRLAINYFESLPAGPLPKQTRETLRIWRLYDKQFVELNEDDAMQSFEVATALRRIGSASLLLEERPQAREFLERADQAFSELENQYPTLISYRLDHAATLLQLAQVAQLDNDQPSAIKHCQAAMSALLVEQALTKGEFDLGVAKLVHSAASMLLALGKSEAARQLSSRNIEILEKLDDRQVDLTTKTKLLNESRAILQSLNHEI